jgi:hypothetical protein
MKKKFMLTFPIFIELSPARIDFRPRQYQISLTHGGRPIAVAYFAAALPPMSTGAA